MTATMSFDVGVNYASTGITGIGAVLLQNRSQHEVRVFIGTSAPSDNDVEEYLVLGPHSDFGVISESSSASIDLTGLTDTVYLRCPAMSGSDTVVVKGVS